LYLREHCKELCAWDLAGAEGFEVRGHYLDVDPGRASGAQVVDEEEKSEF